MKKLPILTILIFACLIPLLINEPAPAHAQAGTAWQVLAEINNLRATYNLPPLAENQYLNLAAQNHANWIAETGNGGHIGEGGSTAADRALAAGYGEGAQIWVTENWARGSGLTASECVYNMWEPSPDHLNNMLTTWHNEFGAGVALDSSGFTVYVVNFGHTSGSSAPPQATTPPGGPTNTPAPLIQPIVTATPNPDGSVIHIVQYGQTLYAIAEAYGVPLADILALNGLTMDSPIFPDEELLIVAAHIEISETPTAETPVTPTHTPTPTRTITPEPADITPTPTQVEKPRSNFLVNIFSGDTLWVGIGLVVVSVLGIALLLFTSARLK